MRAVARLGTMRVRAESLMTDTCHITRAGEGDPVFEDDGTYTDPPRETVYEGACRFQIRSSVEVNSAAGPQEVAIQYSELQIPVDGTAGVAVDDQVECVTTAYDGSLVSRTWTIVGRHEKSHATSRRLRLVEVVGG